MARVMKNGWINRTADEKNRDYELVCSLRRNGKTWKEVTAEVNKAYTEGPTISFQALNEWYRRWTRNEKEYLVEDEIKKQLATLEWQEEELIQAWEESKGEITKVSEKQIVTGDIDENAPKEITRKTETVVGNVSILAELRATQKRKAELLGMDAPKKVARTDKDGNDVKEDPIVIFKLPDNGKRV